MRVLLVSVIFCGTTFAQLSLPAANSVPGPDPDVRSTGVVNALPDLPPVPRGRSTQIGGIIRGVDHVRDQLTVNVFGGHEVKVFFDERTEVFRDGQRVPLRDMKNADRASVETVLDGNMVFARSVHILSAAVEGVCQGQVLNFNAARGELSVRDPLFADAIDFRVPPGITISREGQEAFATADLRQGALVRLKFQPGGSGQGVVTSIAILATPGAPFVFSGRVTHLDLHAGLLSIVDQRDQKRYDISFTPDSLMLQDVHEGSDVTVSAMFDGAQYSASAVKLNSAPAR